jgi:hypothetical protein
MARLPTLSALFAFSMSLSMTTETTEIVVDMRAFASGATGFKGILAGNDPTEALSRLRLDLLEVVALYEREQCSSNGGITQETMDTNASTIDVC